MSRRTWIAIALLATAGAGAQDAWALGRPRPNPTPTPTPTSPPLACNGVPDNAFQACLYDQAGFSDLKVVRNIASIESNWGQGSPDPAIAPDSFSARYSGRFQIAEQGDYRFTVTADDGVRLWVNDRLVIDRWVIQSASTYTADVTLSPGMAKIVLEYFEEGGDASLQLSWAMLPAGPCYPGLSARSEEGAILETARLLKVIHPEFFVEVTEQRQLAYHMNTEFCNVLRHNGHNVGRAIAHDNMPPSNPYRWGSDAIGYRTSSGAWRIYDTYGSYPIPGNPQTLLHGEGQAEVTGDLIAVGSGRRCQ
jgi:hypothetical protein